VKVLLLILQLLQQELQHLGHVKQVIFKVLQMHVTPVHHQQIYILLLGLLELVGKL